MATPHIVIIGAGRIGRALADLVRDGESDCDVHLWDNNPSLVAGQLPVAQTVPGAIAVFICVPSSAVRTAISEIVPLLTVATPVITLAKGFEAATELTMPELARKLLPTDQPYAALGGPMLAETLEHGHRGIGVVASTDDRTYTALAPLFAGTQLTLERTTDISGVALCGALKNVYAFLVGMSTGIGWTLEQQRLFFQSARQEMLESGRALGIAETTLSGPAGLGDFVETATSTSSHNHYIGAEFGRTGHLLGVCEATIALPALRRHLDMHHFPFLDAGATIVSGTQPPSALKTLISTE